MTNRVLKELMELIVNKNVIVKMGLNVIDFLVNVNVQVVGKEIIVKVNVNQTNGVVNVNLIVTVLGLVLVINILDGVSVRMDGLGKNVKKFVSVDGSEKDAVQNAVQFVVITKVAIQLLDIVYNAMPAKAAFSVNKVVL